jgi:hypothetical protein
MIVIGIVGLAQIVGDRRATAKQREARASQLGSGVGLLTAIGWAPAVFLFTRRWARKSNRP